jgi:uncharacterized protein (UPF0261 family)
MARADAKLRPSDKPLVAVTNVGITTQGVMRAVAVLEQAGYETIVFHAVGTGGRAMEQLMREGVIGAVLDYATIEVSNEMHHALLAGGAERLTTAGKLDLPQVLCPGAIEVLVFNEPETVPARYRGRRLVRHTPKITDLRLNKAEMAEVGEEVARRLRHTRSDAVFLIPTAGYDTYATKGEPFYDPEADAAFVSTLKAQLPKNIRIIERDSHIEDPSFAEESAELLMSLIESRRDKVEVHG